MNGDRNERRVRADSWPSASKIRSANAESGALGALVLEQSLF